MSHRSRGKETHYLSSADKFLNAAKTLALSKCGNWVKSDMVIITGDVKPTCKLCLPDYKRNAAE